MANWSLLESVAPHEDLFAHLQDRAGIAGLIGKTEDLYLDCKTWGKRENDAPRVQKHVADSRAGAVATLLLGSFYHAGDQWMLHFDEKNGKSREIPVRHDLEQIDRRLHRCGG